MSEHAATLAVEPAVHIASLDGDATNSLDWRTSRETLGALMAVWSELSPDLRLRIACGVIDAMETPAPDDPPRR